MKLVKNEKLYDVHELATMLGMHRDTVRRHMHTEKLKGVRVGNKMYVHEDKVDSFIKGRSI